MDGLTHLQAQFLLRSGEKPDAAMQASLDAHLGDCAECQRYASLIRHLEQALPLQEAAAARSAHPPASDRSARSKSSNQNRSQSMYRKFKNAWSTIAWAGLMVLMAIGIRWSIQHFLPAARFGGQTAQTATTIPTASPTASMTPTWPPPPTESAARPPSTTAPSTQPPYTYLVQNGDTCLGIAATFGVSPESLIALNGLGDGCGALFVGQSLLIPAPAGTPSAGRSAAPPPAYPILSPLNLADFGPLGQIELANGEWPSSLAWSPDGAWLAVHTQNEVLAYRLDDPATPGLRWNAPGSQVAYSPDGRWLANDVNNLTGMAIELRDAASGELAGSLAIPTLSSPYAIYCSALAFSPDGTSLAAACEGKVVVWEVASQAVRWQAGTNVQTLAFSPEGDELAVSGWQMPPTLYDTGSGEALRQLESDSQQIKALVYDPGGAWIAAVDGRDNLVQMWERASGKILMGKLPGITSWMENLAASRQGVLLGSLQDDRLLAWDALTGELLRVIELDAGMIMQMAFSPDGGQLASIDNWRPVVRLWAVTPQVVAFPTDVPPTPVPEASGPTVEPPTIVFGLEWAAQAERLLANSTKGIFVYDTATRQPVFSLGDPEHLYATAAIDPAGQRLAIRTGSWEIWDIASGEMRAALGQADGQFMGAAVFSPDGSQLATAEKDGVYLWDLQTQNLVSRLPIEVGARGVAFRPDGQTLVVLTADGWLQTVDLKRSETIRSVDVGLAFLFRFSPDAAWLAIQRRGGVEVWNTASGEKQNTFEQCGSDVWFGAFDPTGQRLLTGPCSIGSQAMLYPAAGGAALLTLAADFANTVEWRSAAFSPDGGLLALGNTLGQVQFFDPASGGNVGTIQVSAK